VEQSQRNFVGNISIQNHSSPPLIISNLGTRFFLRGVDCDAPGFQLPSLTLVTGSAGSNQSNPGQT
jgi:hypothetical protein